MHVRDWTRPAAWAALGIVMGIAVAVLSAEAADRGTIWWEGEDTAETNFPTTSDFSPRTFANTAHLLSEGEWLSNSGARTGPEAYATYEVDVPADATYDLWVRKFWKHGPFQWRFGDAAWTTCGRDIALADSTYLRTHLGANWAYLGEATLRAGRTTYELSFSRTWESR